ncbi:hypothetical protein HY635_00740 [Candidatus Uhrbacteria bacterium]|nr:hypothetical protein [Candidatus Uhrbacteria bacterium]
MRSRVIGAIIVTVAAYTIVAFLWRTIFPFRDGIVEFLPEDTIAYAHVNLTPQVRREVEFQISDFRFQIGDLLAEAMRTAVQSTDVREFGIAWYQPKTLPPQIALIIGQRASNRPDVVSPMMATISGTDTRLIVVRTHAAKRYQVSFERTPGISPGISPHPVQAFVRPPLLPIPALDAARHLLPETMTATGTINRRGFIPHQFGGRPGAGFILRSDGRIPLVMRTARMPLLVSAQPSMLQIIGLPVRAIAAQLDLPFHQELRSAIEPFLPEAADLLMSGRGVTVRFALPSDPPSNLAVRSLAARIWPSVQTRRLDGLPATVQVADPSEFEITSVGANRWVIKRQGTDGAAVTAERREGQLLLSTDAPLLDKLRDSSENGLAFPMSCRFSGEAAFAVWSPYPQLIASVSMDQTWSKFAVCGRSP